MKEEKPVSAFKDAVNAPAGDGKDTPYLYISHLPTLSDYAEMRILLSKSMVIRKNDILFKIAGFILWIAAVVLTVFFSNMSKLPVIMTSNLLLIFGFILIFYHDTFIPAAERSRAKSAFKNSSSISQVRTISLYDDRLLVNTGESSMEYPLEKATQVIDGDNSFILSFGIDIGCQIPKRLIGDQQIEILDALFNKKCEGRFRKIRIGDDSKKPPENRSG